MRYLFLLAFFTLFSFSAEYIHLGKFTNDNSIFIENNISKLSQKFLDTTYVSNTLSNIEINISKENLIINFEALDCFTFIDTIEALKNSNDLTSFKNKLINTRYKDGQITYHNRNHFFSDWLTSNDMQDITCTLGNCKKQQKFLNQNFKYLKEIPTVNRDIFYIAAKDIDLSKLQNGDYVGIYTKLPDLDVTHTGIIVKSENQVFIRHASSKMKKVIDDLLIEYTKNKTGVIIYRAKKR